MSERVGVLNVLAAPDRRGQETGRMFYIIIPSTGSLYVSFKVFFPRRSTFFWNGSVARALSERDIIDSASHNVPTEVQGIPSGSFDVGNSIEFMTTPDQ